MAKVLIMSDSHGLSSEIQEIKDRHQLTYMIHCGDSELDSDHAFLNDMICVKGNCDFSSSFVNDNQVKINNIPIFITHGHLYDVRRSLMPLSYRAQEENSRIVCFGHTHVAGAEKINDILFINPGSIRLPRNRKEKTYAILNLDYKNKVKVEFYIPSGDLVRDLTYITSLE